MSQYMHEVKKMMNKAAEDPGSWINEGLVEMSEMFSYRWVIEDNEFPRLIFVHKNVCELQNLCEVGACDCPVDHRCEGCECGSCLCSMGDCECGTRHMDLYSQYCDGDSRDVLIAGCIRYAENGLTNGLHCFINGSSASAHPHVAVDGTICWGNSDDPQSLVPRDHFLRVLGWVGQHSQEEQYNAGLLNTLESTEFPDDDTLLDAMQQNDLSGIASSAGLHRLRVDRLTRGIEIQL